MQKIVLIFTILLSLVPFMGAWQFIPANAAQGSLPWRALNAPANKLDPVIQKSLVSQQPGEMLSVIITLRQQADLSQVGGADPAACRQGLVRALQATANATQGRLIALLNTRQSQGAVARFEPFWVFNGFSLTATPAMIAELAQDPDVLSFTPDDIQIVPAQLGPAEANISLINAPALWDQGKTGQGVVVASMDSGVDAAHPDLASRYRGGGNSWYDPYGQHSAPFDATGHGTQVMGVIVGGDAGGTTIGVAPGAWWIGVKIFNDQGGSTATAIHQGFQWLLDPDGNPATDDAPQVVNNSWAFGAPGCNLEFQLDLQALRLAGILPVFAAGNYGPNAPTSVSPANYPEAFAVGAINNSSQLYSYSSRGPSACGETQSVYPELVAPGVSIRTSDRYGFYTTATGTSLAAPHVAGALALLLSAYPNLTADQQRDALLTGAVDLGPAGPDNSYGYGRLDVQASYNWLLAGGANPTPTPTPQPTPTPVTTLHVGDLDRSTASARKAWNATVTIVVHDAAERLVANANVAGRWSNGATGTASCVTNNSGACTMTKTGLKTSTSSVIFSVTGVTYTSLSYQAANNHDPDGESNGTTITVSRP